jgi:hypothetical protein
MTKEKRIENEQAWLARIAEVLKTTPEKLAARVIGMRLGETCGRCGGCGRYSYNQMHGDMCYGCRGYGTVMPKPSRYMALYENAKVAASDGSLERYLDGLRAKSRSKNASKRIFAAWHEVEAIAPYDWRQVGDAEDAIWRTPEQKRILWASALNQRCYDAHMTFEKVDMAFQSEKVKDWVAYEATLTAALETIAAAKADALKGMDDDHIDQAERFYNVQ